MEDIFGQIECRTKSDSIVMRILRSAMDEAHEKLQSKDGPIQFLHDRSTFYQLAAILVEGGLNIVQEEKTDITEDNCNKILSDLTEIKSWLQGRIQDMKHLIVEKDRELTDRLENELRLQQTLELKDGEIFYLHEKLEPGRANDEDIVKLKSSVDQQVSNIRQKLEDEKKILNVERRNKKTRVSSPNLSFDFLDKERNGSPVFAENERFSDVKPNNNQNVLIREMSSDIDILKETLDLAFGRMHSFETFPLEKQWRCAIEKDVESVLVKGFVSDLKRSFDVESKERVGFLSDDWFEFIDEMRNLCCELKDFFTINDVHEKGSIILRSSSEPLSDIEYTEEDGGKKHVAKMKWNFESIIRKQVEELNRMKREEGSFCRVERDRVNNELERRIKDVVTRLDNCTKRDQKKSRISKSDRYSKVESLLELEIEKLKEERDGLYRLLLHGTTDEKDIDELQGLNLTQIMLFYLESIIMEDLYMVVFRETVKQWKEFLDETTTGSLLKEDIYMVFLREMVNAWKWEKDACTLESLIREDIYRFVVIEAVKDSHADLLKSEALKQLDSQEHTPHSRKMETDGDESLIQKLDSLLKCLEAEEDSMLSANSEIKEHNVNNSLVILNCEEMDDRNAIEWLITDDESTFISASEKLEKASQQLYKSKELLVELEQSLKVSEDLEESYCQWESNDMPSIEYEKSRLIFPSDDVLRNIMHFQGLVGSFEHVLQENLESKCLRLEALKHEVDTLIKPVALIRKRKLLYKKAFLSRCHSLKLAEAEVDLLGDQVESLLCLLERIYFELNQNAKKMSAYFEVYDILKLIKRELNGGRSCKPRS